MSMSKLSLTYWELLGPKFLKKRWLLRAVVMTSSVLFAIFKALSSQIVTHSAHPLHLLGSMMMLNIPPDSPFFLGASKYFLVRDHWARNIARSAGSVIVASRSSSSVSESTLPKIAVSGHWVTQSMQPVQFSAIYRGISGAMLLKSRRVAVPAGISERASERSAGSPFSAEPSS